MDNYIKLKELLTEKNISYSLEDKTYLDGRSVEVLRMEVPMEREKIDLFFRNDDENLEKVVNSDFLKYRGIINYEAIWSKDLKVIESEIIYPNSNIPPRFLFRRLKHIFNNKTDDVEEISDDDTTTDIPVIIKDGAEISIGGCSLEFAIISMYKEGRARDLFSFQKYRPTIKIKNVKVETHEKALELLVKISNSIFFQIDLIYNFTVILGPQRESYILRRKFGRSNSSEVEKREISLNQEYDKIPLSLYWFGKTSHNLTIFQYLAYYQALEYYFSIYSIEDAKTHIRDLVKDPRFNIFNDGDILKLLSLIKANKISGIGEEKEQILITLKAIISYEDIIDFINENSDRKDYFNGKEASKISAEKLTLNDTTGLVNSLGKRIYDIRCKIVHNKASEMDNKLMPFTNEVKFLKYDIELLEFVVRKVIISNSNKLSNIG